MRGFDIKEHALACFGGAAAQHACSLARELGIGTIFIHRFAGILSAYGWGSPILSVKIRNPLLPFWIRKTQKICFFVSSKWSNRKFRPWSPEGIIPTVSLPSLTSTFVITERIQRWWSLNQRTEISAVNSLTPIEENLDLNSKTGKSS